MNIDRQELDALTKQIKDPKQRSVAFSRIVAILSQPIYWHIRKMVLTHADADDLLQNTFMKVWQKIDAFRGDSQIHTWIYRIATNETLTFLTQQRLKNNASALDVEEILLNNLRADQYFDGNVLQERLEEAILTLPEKQRLVFNMRYYDDMPYEDMAEICNNSVGALKASYHHAVKKIKAIFMQED